MARWLERPGGRERGRRLENGWRTWADERGRSGSGFAGLPYVMLHSLAHMLMTSIALDCGYPASSLRERVYAGDDRYGILIYTGSSDSEGTLGGLVETGRRFADHLRRALRDNLLCSTGRSSRRPSARRTPRSSKSAASIRERHANGAAPRITLRPPKEPHPPACARSRRATPKEP